MFGAYLLGFVGLLIAIVGIGLLVVSCAMAVGEEEGAALVAGIGLAAAFAGGYLRYLSRQTVRPKQEMTKE